MSNKKMIHVFNEMVVKAGKDIDTADLHFINGGVSATFFCAQQAHHAAHAINNHDRLVEENAELREALKRSRDGYSNLIELGALPSDGWNGQSQDLIKMCDNLLAKHK